MRVLQVNTSIGKGSTGRISEDIADAVESHGGKSFLSGSRNSSSIQSRVIKIGNKWDFFTHVISTRLLDNHGFNSKKSTKRFLKEIEKINPQVIHLHNIHGYYLHVGILFDFLKSSKIPVVWTLHDCWPFTGHCAYFDRVECQKWKTQCHSCPLTSYYPKSYFRDNSRDNFILKKRHFTGLQNLTICTPSHWLKALVKESFLSKYPVEVIHNGIDLEIFQPKVKIDKIEHEPIRVLGVANVWDSRKGLDDFIELNSRLRGKVKIKLVGVSRKLRKSLPEDIIGIERTDSVDKLAELYKEADVFVNPTYSDNFPTTNIEALASGTPVITYGTGGSPEAIDDMTGICVERGDVKGLATALRRIVENPEVYSADACSNRARIHFNKDRNFMSYIELYKRILN